MLSSSSSSPSLHARARPPLIPTPSSISNPPIRIPANAVMLYAPRDETELDVIETLVGATHAFARPT